MPEDMTRYRELFQEEAQELTRALGDNLLKLERNPSDPSVVNELFRSAHTLKGMASAMGLQQVSDLAHAMEALLDQFRRGERAAGGAQVDLLLQALECLEGLIAGQDLGLDAIMTRLKAEREGLGSTPGAAPVPAAVPGSPAQARLEGPAPKASGLFQVDVRAPEHRRITRRIVDETLRKLGLLGEVAGSSPDPREMKPHGSVQHLEVFLRGGVAEAEIRAVLGSVEGLGKVMVQANATAAQAPPLEPPPTREGTVPPAATVVAASGAPPSPAPPTPEGPHLADPTPAAVTTLKVNVRKLDELMNTVGEMVISKLRLLQIARTHGLRDLEEVATNVDRLTSGLQDLVLEVRLIPLGNVFEKFPRMVRDLARKLGKDVDLVLEGSDIELDRTIIAEIDEPLIHLLRNAVDHGIEPPEERTKAGKPERGTLHLSARREQSWVYVEVEDDGRGIDPARVKRRAVERGMITAERAAAMDDEAALNIIFTPGFSTAAVVTETSGRGVGLDVVRTKVRGMGGSVVLHTFPGRGTRVTLRLPLSVAIIQALLVSALGETYALPLDSVLETQLLEPSTLATVGGAYVLKLRGQVIPLAPLGYLLGRQPSPDTKGGYIVIVEKGERRYGLLVDTIQGQQSVVTKPLDQALRGTRGFSGATILGDGRVCLILDVAGLAGVVG